MAFGDLRPIYQAPTKTVPKINNHRGAGKTNIAVLTILRLIGQHMDAAGGAQGGRVEGFLVSNSGRLQGICYMKRAGYDPTGGVLWEQQASMALMVCLRFRGTSDLPKSPNYGTFLGIR